MKKLLIIALIALSFVFVGCKEQSITGGAVAVDKVIERCKDSDGGIDKDVKGIVSVGGEDYSDACVAGLLIEHYCDGDDVANQNLRCPNECSNGKCA